MTFDKTGIPVGCYYETEYIPSETEVKLNDLNLQLKKAVEKEDYLKAADLKKQIDALEKTNN
jgi:protein-arginine kinase activator protein McsA